MIYALYFFGIVAVIELVQFVYMWNKRGKTYGIFFGENVLCGIAVSNSSSMAIFGISISGVDAGSFVGLSVSGGEAFSLFGVTLSKGKSFSFLGVAMSFREAESSIGVAFGSDVCSMLGLAVGLRNPYTETRDYNNGYNKRNRSLFALSGNGVSVFWIIFSD